MEYTNSLKLPLPKLSECISVTSKHISSCLGIIYPNHFTTEIIRDKTAQSCAPLSLMKRYPPTFQEQARNHQLIKIIYKKFNVVQHISNSKYLYKLNFMHRAFRIKIFISIPFNINNIHKLTRL